MNWYVIYVDDMWDVHDYMACSSSSLDLLSCHDTCTFKGPNVKDEYVMMFR